MTQKIVFCFHTNDHEYNMGIGFLSSFLKKNGVDVGLVIYREIEGKVKDSPEDVVKRILEQCPTIVAFSVMTFNWHLIKKVIDLLRGSYGGLVAVGGYHAILAPKEVLGHPGVDVICIGEGEEPLLKLAQYCATSGQKDFPDIAGLVFRERPSATGWKRWLVEKLEDYPYMDFGLFDDEGPNRLSEKFLGTLSPAGIFSLPVITGRGCPFKCTYCSNSALIESYGGIKRFLRRYNVGTAVENMKEAADRYRPQFLEFLDETFTLNKAWIKEFCSRYKHDVGLPFSVMSRIDTMDEGIVSVMVESGLKLVFFGLESGDEEYRIKYLNRKMFNETIVEGAKILKKYGVMIVTFNIFGMPFETKDAVKKTFDLNACIEPDAAIPFIYQVFPATELARIAYKNNMVPPRPEGRWDYCTPSLDTAELPAADVIGIVEDFREKFGNPDVVERVYSRLREIIAS
ncbi:MAG: radical SAM protein [Nitrospiraceae bacterium]|nr:radical SAM protein [Nitrospiraceae bacterium]